MKPTGRWLSQPRSRRFRTTLQDHFDDHVDSSRDDHLVVKKKPYVGGVRKDDLLDLDPMMVYGLKVKLIIPCELMWKKQRRHFGG